VVVDLWLTVALTVTPPGFVIDAVHLMTLAVPGYVVSTDDYCNARMYAACTALAVQGVWQTLYLL